MDILEIYFKKSENVYLFFVAFVLIFGFFLGRISSRMTERKNIKKERGDAVKKSRAVIAGQVSEQLAPFLPGFPCNPGDAKFLGCPVDYVAFRGSAAGKKIEEILLIEVKSGHSKLSEREMEVRDAVREGRVRYVEYRIPS